MLADENSCKSSCYLLAVLRQYVAYSETNIFYLQSNSNSDLWHLIQKGQNSVELELGSGWGLTWLGRAPYPRLQSGRDEAAEPRG
jgi:hypothetical protein